MFSQPGLDRGVLVRGVVVTDHMDLEVFRHGPVDLDQEFLERDGTGLAVDRGNHRTVGDIHRREQGRRAVPDIIVRAPLRNARHQRKRWLGSL